MKKESTKRTNLDALLGEMPIEPGNDFAERVLADCEIRKMLREMPIEPSKDFAKKTIASAYPKSGNCMRFNYLSRFAAAAIIAIGIFTVVMKSGTEASLASRIELALQNDPELSFLAQADDESPSFDELIAASEILANIDPSILEIFAYND